MTHDFCEHKRPLFSGAMLDQLVEPVDRVGHAINEMLSLRRKSFHDERSKCSDVGFQRRIKKLNRELVGTRGCKARRTCVSFAANPLSGVDVVVASFVFHVEGFGVAGQHQQASLSSWPIMAFRSLARRSRLIVARSGASPNLVQSMTMACGSSKWASMSRGLTLVDTLGVNDRDVEVR